MTILKAFNISFQEREYEVIFYDWNINSASKCLCVSIEGYSYDIINEDVISWTSGAIYALKLPYELRVRIQDLWETRVFW